MGIIAVYIPMHAPWMILIIIKFAISVMYNKEPAINAVTLITKRKFLLEKTWINFFPSKAPSKAPKGMQPVNIPRAVSRGIVTLNVYITSVNSTVLM